MMTMTIEILLVFVDLTNLLQGLLPLGSSRRRREGGEVLRGFPACSRDRLAPAENVRMLAYMRI